MKIDTGTIEGAISGNVLSFKGIPYAAPPENRQGKGASVGDEDAAIVAFIPKLKQNFELKQNFKYVFLLSNLDEILRIG